MLVMLASMAMSAPPFYVEIKLSGKHFAEDASFLGLGLSIRPFFNMWPVPLKKKLFSFLSFCVLRVVSSDRAVNRILFSVQVYAGTKSRVFINLRVNGSTRFVKILFGLLVAVARHTSATSRVTRHTVGRRESGRSTLSPHYPCPPKTLSGLA